MRKTKNLRLILSIFVVIITIVTSSCIFLITSYIYLKSNKNNLTNVLNEQALREASLLNDKLTFSGKTAVNIADMIETMPIYQEKIIFDKVSQKLTNDPLLFGIGVWFEPYVYNKEQKYYGPYMYRDNNQENIFTWEYNTPEYNYFNWDWYQVVFSPQKSDIYFSNLFYDKVMNTYFMTGTAPIMKDNRIIGAATADISLREVAQYVNKIKVGYQGYAFVLTNNGYIIGTPPDLDRADPTSISDPADYDIGRISNVLEEGNEEYQVLEKLVMQSEASGLMELKNNQEIAYYTNIGNTGLKLVLIYPKKELYSSFYSSLKYYVFLFILSVISIPLLLIFVIKKMIDQPMSKLLRKVNKMMQGDFTKDSLLQSVIASNDEFGILGNAVIKMSDNMNDLVHNLNAQNNELMESNKKLELSEKKFRLIFEASHEGLWDLDLQTNIRTFSDRWVEIFGHKISRISASRMENWFALIHPDDHDRVEKLYNDIVTGKIDIMNCEYRIKDFYHNHIWITTRAKSLRDRNGKPYRLAGAHADISQRKLDEAKIRSLAYYDVLTGLPNRVYFSEEVNRLIASYGKKDKFAIFFIDLDNFKMINDTYGHATGDEVLVSIAQRLGALTGEKISASRFGGDEFILIIKDTAGRDELSMIAQDVHRIIYEPIYIGEDVFYVSVSIGISIYPDDAPSLNELLKNADTAMFKGKEEGRARSKFFHQKMNQMILERSELESKLRLSLANNEFRLYYQPLYDVKSAKIVGFEALLRWVTPDMGVVLPDKFIKHVEDTRLVIPLGNWVIKTACRFAKKLIDTGYPDLSVSVNVSVVQILHEDFVAVVMDAVKAADIPAHNIRLEITESKLMESYDLCIQNILKLKMQGIRFAIDDFGTGYSSLNYLRQLPISAIKIDKSFIRDLSYEANNNLTEIIIVIAHKMRLEIVAEGVETPEQFDLLKVYGCNIIQGFIISKPLPEEEIIQFFLRKI